MTVFRERPASRAVATLLAIVMAGTTLPVMAQEMTPMDAPDEPNAIPLNTGGVDNQPASESWFEQWGDPMARNITEATLTPFLPDPDKANGAAVLVAPGGGFMWLSMGNEGWEVAEALNEQGVAAFVLKYRLQPTADRLEDFEGQMNRRFEEADTGSDGEEAPDPRPRWDLSNQLEDAEAAWQMIADNADEWGVDMDRLGMMGFSAGAGLTMHVTMNSETARPAFIAPIYGGMGEVEVPKDAPPLFVAIAVDDFLYNGDTGLIKSWYEAEKPVELHLFQNGGHGFGLGNPDRTSNIWFKNYIHWLDVNGFLEEAE
nr:alpha/beta hydrolase [Aquisalinus luteolus]